MPEATSTTLVRYDLAHYGRVTAVTSPTVFNIGALAGFGDAAFAGGAPYSVYVLRDVAGLGAAPQGELRTITAYVSTGGLFTVTAAFTVPVAVGDEVLVLHPSVAGSFNLSGVSLAGVHAHADDLLWQQVFEFNPLAVRRKVQSIWMDFANFAGALQTVTYRLSYMVDGVNFRIFDTNAAAPWTIAADDGVLIALLAVVDHPLRLEIQKSVAEGAARNVPYEVIYENMS